MAKQVSERELILEILLEITEKGQFSHIILRQVLDKYQYLEKRERAFISRVTQGTLEHMIEMDYILDQFSKVKTTKMKPVIRTILRMSVYQLKYMDSVPDSAVCNEAVKLAVKKGFGNLRGFVNGVLRNVARNLDRIPMPQDETLRMSVEYSIPKWILDLWMQSYDTDTVQTMGQEFLKEKPLTIRVREDRINEVKQAMEEQGIIVERSAYLPYAFEISNYDHVEELPGFSDGSFFVQDVSSMLVAEAAHPKEGFQCVDVCAAPGGKALHLAQKLNGTGMVRACDLTPYKVNLIQENIDRMGLANIEAICHDACVKEEDLTGKMDLVIADLPCSGLGVLGKKPEMKYRITQKQCEELSALQKNILDVVCEYVRPGGRLIYSTCTIQPSENEKNVEWFLKDHSDFQTFDLAAYLPEDLKRASFGGMLQLLPGIHHCDGFFISGFERKGL